MRMVEMTKAEEEYVNSRWVATVYLLSAHGDLWWKLLFAGRPN